MAGTGSYAGSLIHEMQIRSNNIGELISFQYYDSSEDEILEVNPDHNYTFSMNEIVGSQTDVLELDAAICFAYEAPPCADDGLGWGLPFDCPTAFTMGASCVQGLWTFTGENISEACPVTCNACDDDSEDDCVQDCAGTWGGALEDDECGVCDGDGIADGECDCDGNVDLGCGCDEAGPSGCDETCGSTLER